MYTRCDDQLDKNRNTRNRNPFSFFCACVCVCVLCVVVCVLCVVCCVVFVCLCVVCCCVLYVVCCVLCEKVRILDPGLERTGHMEILLGEKPSATSSLAFSEVQCSKLRTYLLQRIER